MNVWACSRFLPESLERLGKFPSCLKDPTRMTQGDNAVFTTSRKAQLSPDLPKVFVRGDRVKWVA